MINILFPALCLHCNEPIEQKKHLFCSGCLPYFELYQPHIRFSLGDLNVPVAAALEYIGPTQTFVNKLNTGQSPYLAKTAAAFMTTQLCQLGWEFDGIVPVARSRVRVLLRGIDHTREMAQELSKNLSCPVFPVLRRRGGEFPQGRLNPQQRERLTRASFSLGGPKKILLIDDVLTTGATLRAAAETLFEAYPAKIYALTLCG